MIKLNINNWRGTLHTANYVEHYQTRYFTIAVRPSGDLFNLTIGCNDKGDGLATLDDLTSDQVYSVFYNLLHGILINEADDGFWQWINQADRECYIVKWTPTRVRIEYEMPNTGTNGAWRHWIQIDNIHRLVFGPYITSITTH